MFVNIFSGIMDLIGFVMLFSPLKKKIYPIEEIIQNVDELSCEDDISA
ncbi:hypothetical protein CIY_16160 [Butyrivibrio fibrisolvens 16/4]|nr:hypothetical protein CIY_16160 [Butyrivibrio fibrisolvens 16/4]